MMDTETSTRMSPPMSPQVVPERLWFELAEAVMLIFFDCAYIIVGILNIHKLYKQKRAKLPLQHNGQVASNNSFLLFKTSLFVSDCLIMFWYASVKIVWLLQFKWNFGWFLCKIYRYGSSVAFFSNSNIVAGIALDRYLSVYSNHIIGVRQYQRTRQMLFVAWIIALIAALPQLIVWETYRPSDDWEQCVTVFAIQLYELPLDSPDRANANFWSLIYEGYHQSMAFWIPLLITFGCYLRMMSRLIPFWPFSVLNSYEDRQQETLCTIFWTKLSQKICSFFCVTILRRKSRASQLSARVPLTGTTRHAPTTALRRQLGTTVFKHACAIILIHIGLWLPYNVLSLSRFVNEPFYEWTTHHGGNLLEGLILFGSFINPILYAGGANTIHRV